MSATTTYTLAISESGVLIATVPDHGDIYEAVADTAERAGIMPEDLGDFAVLSGLLLVDEVNPEIDEVIFTGFEMGWPKDENGQTHNYAVRRHQPTPAQQHFAIWFGSEKWRVIEGTLDQALTKAKREQNRRRYINKPFPDCNIVHADESADVNQGSELDNLEWVKLADYELANQ